MLGDEGGPQVLEVNAIPGLTDTSLLPMAAEAAGLASSGSSSGRWSWRCGLGRATSSLGLVAAGGEVLGRHLVEEVLELLDDLLVVLDLVLELDRGLLDHFLGGEYRRGVADGEGHRVGGTRVDLDSTPSTESVIFA